MKPLGIRRNEDALRTLTAHHGARKSHGTSGVKLLPHIPFDSPTMGREILASFKASQPAWKLALLGWWWGYGWLYLTLRRLEESGLVERGPEVTEVIDGEVLKFRTYKRKATQ